MAEQPSVEGFESGFVPGRHLIDAYGNGGFRFAEHVASRLDPGRCPRASAPGTVTEPRAIDRTALAPGPGRGRRDRAAARRHRPRHRGRSTRRLRGWLKDAGIGLDVMQTGAAARTYNILVAENRKVAAALIAVDLMPEADGKPAETGPRLRASHCEDLVRAGDPDRYFATLFAPAAARPHLFALYAFSLTVARVREAASNPMAGEIRLQWWRDALQGEARGDVRANPVAAALDDAIAVNRLGAPALRRPDRRPRVRPLRRPDAPAERPGGLLRRDRLGPVPAGEPGDRRRRRAGERERRARQLGIDLLEVVEIDVAVTAHPDQAARLEVELLGDQVGQQP